MHFHPLPTTTEGTPLVWALDASRGRCGARIESSPGGRLRLTVGDAPRLWWRIERGYRGVWLVRSDAHEALAVVPPIRADEARDIRDPDGWSRFFAEALVASPRAPLSAGSWRLSAMAPRGRVPDAFHLPAVPDGPRSHLRLPETTARSPTEFLDWMAMRWTRLVPLRETRSEDARVRAWRKHARAGTLPPALLWWVNALQAFVVLDGHDRLEAARLEAQRPGAVALWQEVVDDAAPDAAWLADVLAGYARAFENESKLSLKSRRSLNEGLVRAHAPWIRWVSHARVAPALDEAWEREVRRALRGADVETLAAVLGEGDE